MAQDRERDRDIAIVEQLPNPVAQGHLEDGRLRIYAVNPAFSDAFDCDRDAIDGDTLQELLALDSEERQTDEETLAARLRVKGDLHTEVEVPSGDSERTYRVDLTLEDPASTTPGVYAVFTDITEHKNREREREARYEAIFNQTYQFTGLLDPDGTLLEANETALEFGDLEREDVIGKPFWEAYWWQTDEATQEELRDAIDRARDGEFVRYEVEVQGKDETVTIDFSIRPITNESDQVTYLIPEGRNITELKTVQERKRELERQNERLDEFVGVVSHDLRNPLNVARGRLTLAEEECQSEHLGIAADAIDRSLALIDDLLALAREGQQVDELDPVDLSSAVAVSWRTVETGDASLIRATERTILASESRLKQLLENVISNAVEHGGEGVTVTVGDREDGFYVADDGPGIPPTHRERVFEPGYSTTDEGTGFGLNIVREIADAHEWTISVGESDTGGTRFEFTGVDILD